MNKDVLKSLSVPVLYVYDPKTKQVYDRFGWVMEDEYKTAEDFKKAYGENGIVFGEC